MHAKLFPFKIRVTICYPWAPVLPGDVVLSIDNKTVIPSFLDCMQSFKAFFQFDLG